MKYSSLNNLQDFEFHDAFMELISYQNDKLVLSVKHLNIHKATKQNNSDTDMEIALAQITFEGFSVKSFEPAKQFKADENSTADDSVILLEGKEAEQRLIAELQQGVAVYEFGVFDNELYYINAGGVEPWFASQFLFESVIIQWDNYCKKAWYEC